MTKRIFALALALWLVFSLLGCEERARPSTQAPTEPSSIEVRSSAPEEPAASEDPASSEEADLDALVREIVLTYGAEEDPLNGSPQLTPTLTSLYHCAGWKGSEGLTPMHYFTWFFSTTMKEDYEYTQEAYRHPKGEAYGYFFPQDCYEERIQTYFEVDTDYLRSNPEIYHQEYQGYSLGGGGGIGDRPTLTYEYSQEGELLTVVVTETYSASDITHTLTVRLEENGGWKYLSDQVK